MSRTSRMLWTALCVGGCCLLGGMANARELRVCADPNNLPFSNAAGEGFENRIVQIIAADLKATVSYVWWAQRRGNIRNTLGTGQCDVIPGVSQMEALATTHPYYRSGYVFVTPSDRALDINDFDDARLRQLTIGVQMIGDDFSNTPPAHALARRGIVQNVRGYMLYGDYSQDSPARAIVDDVANGRIDVAVVWGPVAGYFAQRQSHSMRLKVVHPLVDAALPMAFAISMGVRKEDRALLAELDAALLRNQAAIAHVLSDFGVPLVDAPGD